MTEENRILFEILKRSLWTKAGARPADTIPDAVRQELRAQTVESLTALHYADGMNMKYVQASRFVQMARAQANAVQLLQGRAFPWPSSKAPPPGSIILCPSCAPTGISTCWSGRKTMKPPSA